jgi:phosphatidylserine/phosphatidylglycerophosphate/cardiolipin synthase-like enzyme
LPSAGIRKAGDGFVAEEISLAYVSTSRESDAGVVDQIGAVARVKNLELGVTGVLLFNGRNFVQFLEGPEDAVEALFAKIKQDERHFSVTVIERKTIQARSFSDWAMQTSFVKCKNLDLAQALPRSLSERMYSVLSRIKTMDAA